MNDKGFTLVEVIAILVVISIVSFVVVKQVGGTLSASKEDAYSLMKNNIVSASRDYILECNSGNINCDLDFANNNITFNASELKNSGFFSNFRSPIDGRDLGNCLVVNASINNGVVDINLFDNCY